VRGVLRVRGGSSRSVVAGWGVGFSWFCSGVGHFIRNWSMICLAGDLFMFYLLIFFCLLTLE